MKFKNSQEIFETLRASFKQTVTERGLASQRIEIKAQSSTSGTGSSAPLFPSYAPDPAPTQLHFLTTPENPYDYGRKGNNQQSRGGRFQQNSLEDEDLALQLEAKAKIEARQQAMMAQAQSKYAEAKFEESVGHAFADEVKVASTTLGDLLRWRLDTPRDQASFVAALNAVYRHLGLCGQTMNCREENAWNCAPQLEKLFSFKNRVLLIGFQPQFTEFLSDYCHVRVIDLCTANIGQIKFNVLIEPPEKCAEAIEWCDQLLVSGSTLTNGTLIDFINLSKPTHYYGVTIAAASQILGLKRFCTLAH